jgi:uncharacterized protein (TIGR03067 family)
MPLAAACCALLTLFGCGKESNSTPDKVEADNLDGMWTTVSMEVEGKKSTPSKPQKREVKGNTVTFHQGGAAKPEIVFTIQLDASKNPRHMDQIHKTASGEHREPCLYELKDNELRIAFPAQKVRPKGSTAPVPLDRPTSFDTKAQPGVIVITLKREK